MKTFTRTEAIKALQSNQDPEDETNFEDLTLKQLEEELCLSGVIHDEDLDKVVEDPQ